MGGQGKSGLAEADVDAVIAEFSGDMRAAIAALLHDVAVLAEGAENASRGYARRDFTGWRGARCLTSRSKSRRK